MVCTSDYRSYSQILLEYYIHDCIIINHHIAISQSCNKACTVNYSPPSNICSKIAIIAVCCIFFGITAYVMTNLNKLYSLRKQETRITISQIIMLATFGICLTIIVYSLGIKQSDNGFIIITTFGAVLSWIFQDTIESTHLPTAKTFCDMEGTNI